MVHVHRLALQDQFGALEIQMAQLSQSLRDVILLVFQGLLSDDSKSEGPHVGHLSQTASMNVIMLVGVRIEKF